MPLMNDSDLVLHPDVKHHLEQALGIDIPDPNSLEFQTLLENLHKCQPELFEKVMYGLTIKLA
jgi:hypothetical protein